MPNKVVEKDERTTFIENISHKYGYNFIAFALLIDVMYRSIMLNEAPWDLLGIIITSGFVMAIYQYQQKILEKPGGRQLFSQWLLLLSLLS
jgi:hypothetical protein